MGHAQSLNKDLAKMLEEHFKPKGINGFTNCCGSCTSNYADDIDGDFEFRENGIFFFRFSLEGMNYEARPQAAYANYLNYDWLMDHWEEETKLIDEFANILEIKCTYKKPKKGKAVKIRFEHPLELEQPVESESSDDSSGSPSPESIGRIKRMIQDAAEKRSRAPGGRRQPCHKNVRKTPYSQ